MARSLSLFRAAAELLFNWQVAATVTLVLQDARSEPPPVAIYFLISKLSRIKKEEEKKRNEEGEEEESVFFARELRSFCIRSLLEKL